MPVYRVRSLRSFIATAEKLLGKNRYQTVTHERPDGLGVGRLSWQDDLWGPLA